MNTYLNASNQMYTLLSDYADEHSTLMKAFAIANATVNTYVGVTQALASSPPPVSFVMAGMVLASGLASVLKIVNTKKGSSPSPSGTVGGGGSGTGGNSGNRTVDTSSGATADTTAVDNSISNEQALQGALENMNLSVSVSEITETQNSVAVSESDSEI